MSSDTLKADFLHHQKFTFENFAQENGQIKGGDAKTRPPKTFICSISKVHYRINNFFFVHIMILSKYNFEWIQNIRFKGIENK